MSTALDRETGAIRRHLAWAMIWLVVALLAGLLVSLQFVGSYPLPGIEWLAVGRLRMAHTHLVLHGFVLNVALGGLAWCVPRRVDRDAEDRATLRTFSLWWQVVVALGVASLLDGEARAVEWAEAPTFVNLLMALLLLGYWGRLAWPLIVTERPQPVSSGCFVGGLTWCLLGLCMVSSSTPELFPGLWGEAFGLLVVHEFLGLGVAYLGIGFLYHFLPRAAGRPLYSQRLGWAGFWAIALVYPLHGLGLFSSKLPLDLPEALRPVEMLAMSFGVLTIVINVFGTLRGSWSRVLTSSSMPWWLAGFGFYLLTGVQVVWQGTDSAQALIHYSDFVVSHSHLSLFGVFGFFANGLVIALAPRLAGRGWLFPRLNVAAFWLVLLGLLGLGATLVAAGLEQGALWQALAPWADVLGRSSAWWRLRTISGAVLLLGQGLLGLHFLLTLRGSRSPAVEGASP